MKFSFRHTFRVIFPKTTKRGPTIAETWKNLLDKYEQEGETWPMLDSALYLTRFRTLIITTYESSTQKIPKQIQAAKRTNNNN